MNEYADICLESEIFVREFFKVYLEDRDFDKIIAMIHKNITWFGTGAQELCNCYEDAIELIKAEKRFYDGKFRMIEQWDKTIPLGENRCLVYGEVDFTENGEEIDLLRMKMRYSIICVLENEEMRLLYCHFSVPNAE